MSSKPVVPPKPQVLSSRRVCESRLFKVEELSLKFSNGEERVYERLMSGSSPAVIIVPVRDDGKVIMIREYGAGVHDYELTLPKGRVESDEDPLHAANRELKEEIGFGAKDLSLVKVISQSPGYMQHKTSIVLARDLYPEKLKGDEPEPVISEVVSIDDLASLVAKDDLTEARSIAALFIVAELLKTQH